MKIVMRYKMRMLIGAIVSFGILIGASCMEQCSRSSVGGIDNNFFQRQWELQQSPVTHFTLNELQSIYDETHTSKTDTKIPEDQDALKPYVFAGNPAALYEFAQRDGGRARLAYNGEKRKLQIERGVLLLIAAVCGEHGDSRVSLDFAADTPIRYEALLSLADIIEKAKELESKL